MAFACAECGKSKMEISIISSGETSIFVHNFIMNIMNDQVHFKGFNIMTIDWKIQKNYVYLTFLGTI